MHIQELLCIILKYMRLLLYFLFLIFVLEIIQPENRIRKFTSQKKF
jgi:hypothetical protein